MRRMTKGERLKKLDQLDQMRHLVSDVLEALDVSMGAMTRIQLMLSREIKDLVVEKRKIPNLSPAERTRRSNQGKKLWELRKQRLAKENNAVPGAPV